jgi:hypothetical protein
MAFWIIWNTSENRQEVMSVVPNQADADAAITRAKKSRDRAHKGKDNLVSKQVV